MSASPAVFRGCLKLLFLVLFAASSPLAAQRAQIWSSFENAEEFQAWSAAGGATAEQSKDFSSWFDTSLKVDFNEPGSSIQIIFPQPQDVHLHEALRFFAYSIQPVELNLIVTDSDDTKSIKRIHLKRGPNHVQLRLSETSRINLRSIAKLKIQLAPGIESATIYFDKFSLDAYNEILARRGKMDIDYSMDVVTDHVPWGVPLAGGPVRVLFVPDVVNGRAAVELAQRFELDFKAISVGSNFGTNIWGFGDFYGKRGRINQETPTSVFSLAHTYLADELINGPEYDVIVLPGSRPWGEYPVMVREAIMKRVSEGAGLVLPYPYFDDDYDNSDLAQISPLVDVDRVVTINPNNFLVEDASKLQFSIWKVVTPHYIMRNVPLNAFPFEMMHFANSRATGEVIMQTDGDNPKPILAVKQYGKGRVAAFAYGERGMLPRIGSIFSVEAEYPYWEYLYSMLGRSIVWAAGRDSDSAIESITMDEKGNAAIEVSGPANDGSLKLEVVFRDGFGEVVDTSMIAVPKSGKGKLKAAYPKDGLKGTVLVDVRLLGGNGVLDWGSFIGEVAEPLKISDIKFAAEKFMVGEKVDVILSLEGKAQKGALLKIRLLDNYNRLIDTAELAAEPGETRLVLDPAAAMTHLVWVDAAVTAGGAELSRKRAEVFYQRGAVWDDYDVVMYLFGPDPMPGLWDTIQKKLKQTHTTTLSSYPLMLCKYANFHVQAQTRISGQESPDGGARDYYNAMKKKYVETGDKFGLVREYCLDDPAYLKQESDELHQLCKPWVPFSPMSYYIYEEPSLTCYGDAVDICFGEHTLKAMREWLKGRYANLDELNETWGTAFSNWDEVVPDDSREAQARGNYASWADHRVYMEKTYADNYRFVAETLKEIDPTGRVLNSGTQIVGAHNGMDYWQLSKVVKHLNPYGGDNQMDFHRTFGNDVKISSGMGYGRSGRDVPYLLYSNLFEGCFAGSYVFWQYSVLDPDMTFSQSAKDMTAGYDELAGMGIARLFKDMPRGTDKIAIHFSMSSTHGTWITDGKVAEESSYHTSPAFDRFVEVRDGWVNLLKDLGYQYDFLAYEEVETGRLIEGGYKVLILPMSVALSPAEAKSVHEFVEAGGTLITDRFAGTMDDRCRWQSKGMIDDVLGLSYKVPVKAGNFTGVGPENNYKSTGAKSMYVKDGAGAGWLNSFGAGKAFTLGFLPDKYVELARDGKAELEKKMLRETLSGAGVHPTVMLTLEDGIPASGITAATYDNGNSTLIGLVRSNEGDYNEINVNVKLPGQGHVYDIRRGKYLGYAGAVSHTFGTGAPAVFALMPEKIGEPVLKLDKSVVSAGEPITLKVTLPGGEGLHTAAVLDVYDPNGKKSEVYSTRMDIDNAGGSQGWNLALDDMKGTWSIRLRETISGQNAVAEFEIK